MTTDESSFELVPEPITFAVPRLGHGIVWSDLVREMELEQEARPAQVKGRAA